jgi:hypothetical protein
MWYLCLHCELKVPYSFQVSRTCLTNTLSTFFILNHLKSPVNKLTLFVISSISLFAICVIPSLPVKDLGPHPAVKLYCSLPDFDEWAAVTSEQKTSLIISIPSFLTLSNSHWVLDSLIPHQSLPPFLLYFPRYTAVDHNDLHQLHADLFDFLHQVQNRLPAQYVSKSKRP